MKTFLAGYFDPYASYEGSWVKIGLVEASNITVALRKLKKAMEKSSIKGFSFSDISLNLEAKKITAKYNQRNRVNLRLSKYWRFDHPEEADFNFIEVKKIA